jgi:hypothetical protein
LESKESIEGFSCFTKKTQILLIKKTFCLVGDVFDILAYEIAKNMKKSYENTKKHDF